MTVITRGFNAYINTLRRWNTEAFNQIRTELAEMVADEFVDKARALAPVRTGFLREGIGAGATGEPGHFIVYSIAGYSGFQEFGFHHYRDGFVPGKFFFTGALSYCIQFLEESGANFVKVSMEDWIEPSSED